MESNKKERSKIDLWWDLCSKLELHKYTYACSNH